MAFRKIFYHLNIAGLYKSNGYGNLGIRLVKGTLKVKLLKYNCSINYQGDDAFELYHPIEQRGWKTVFIKNNKNNITALSVQANPNVNPVIFKKTWNLFIVKPALAGKCSALQW